MSFDLLEGEQTIFSFADALDPDHIPKLLPHRENQQLEIRNAIRPLLHGRTGDTLLIRGGPGFGKTVVVKRMLMSLDEEDTGDKKISGRQGSQGGATGGKRQGRSRTDRWLRRKEKRCLDQLSGAQSPGRNRANHVQASCEITVTDHGVCPKRSKNHGINGHRVEQVAASETAMRTVVREPDRRKMWCPVIACR